MEKQWQFTLALNDMHELQYCSVTHDLFSKCKSTSTVTILIDRILIFLNLFYFRIILLFKY